MKSFSDWLLWMRIFTANMFGFMFLKPYSKGWDEELRMMMLMYDSVKIDSHTIDFTVGDEIIEVWISNKWYAYGYAYNYKINELKDTGYRPKISTMIKLDKLVNSLRRY